MDVLSQYLSFKPLGVFLHNSCTLSVYLNNPQPSSEDDNTENKNVKESSTSCEERKAENRFIGKYFFLKKTKTKALSVTHINTHNIQIQEPLK